MKSILSLVAVCFVVALAGCNNNKTDAASPGAVGEKSGCCSGKSACTAEKNGTNMGAVGEKAECTKTCPMTGKTETVSPGAVGEKKAGGCCAGKSSCGSGAKKVDG